VIKVFFCITAPSSLLTWWVATWICMSTTDLWLLHCEV